MKTEPGKFFQMRTSQAFLIELDKLRKLQDDLPTRAEMLRRLVQYGVKRKIVVHENVT
jgi:hypothetical protein